MQTAVALAVLLHRQLTTSEVVEVAYACYHYLGNKIEVERMSLNNAEAVAVPRLANIESAVERLRESRLTRTREAFAARALRAIAELAEHADESALAEATGAPTDLDVLVQILSEPRVREDLHDPLAAARLRGFARSAQVLAAEGGVLSAAAVAEALGVTRQAVEKRRRAGTLIGLTTGRRGYAYPAWQFDPQVGVLPGLPEVLKALSGHDPWTQAVFMLEVNDRLNGERPLDALRRGDVGRALDAAQLVGEHGAA
ncbi:MAG: hypothetical protein M9890_09110 [Thermomicrobiales bacterium]|nr:hypothetical protein [Thermomicrobiales bacterium]